MDIKHFYIEKGQGEALILLHGNGGDGGYFREQVDVFSERFRVYAVDTRGHGKTPRGELPFTISQFADDLLFFMDGHGIEKAHLLGYAHGAYFELGRRVGGRGYAVRKKNTHHQDESR